MHCCDGVTYKMSSNFNWSSKDDGILIDFVRNHEAIYNVKSKEYRKTQLKQKWWREIGEMLNKTDSDCSKRWCYIRDYYVRRRGKPGNGSSGEAAKKRSDLLSFLDSLPSSQRSTFSSVIIGNTHVNSERAQNLGEGSIVIANTKSERTQNPGEGSIAGEENTHDNSEETQSNTQEIEDDLSDNNDDKKDGEAKSNKKRKNNTHAQECLNLQNGLDETDLFFGLMAKIVKKLPRCEQVKLRMQIGSLVGNAELRHISNDSSQSSAIIYPRSSTCSFANAHHYYYEYLLMIILKLKLLLHKAHV